MHKNNFAECIKTIFIILLCVVFKLLLLKHGKTSLPKNRPQMSDLLRDVTEGPVRVYNQWRIMKIQLVATLRRTTICSCMHLSIVLQT